jgi:hypothetical protein
MDYFLSARSVCIDYYEKACEKPVPCAALAHGGLATSQ